MTLESSSAGEARKMVMFDGDLEAWMLEANEANDRLARENDALRAYNAHLLAVAEAAAGVRRIPWVLHSHEKCWLDDEDGTL